jgi:hypothetical protein
MKTSMKWKKLLFIIFSIFIISSCSKNPEDKIIGVWHYEALDKAGYKFQVEFKKVGVGNYRLEKDGKKDNWNMKYIISGTNDNLPFGTYTLQVPYEEQNFELTGDFKMIDDNSMVFGIKGRDVSEVSEVILKKK